MRKVLLIGFFWPYCNGSRRVIGLAKYLPGFGWEPLILTAPLERSPNSQFRVFETPSFDTATASFKRKLGLNPNRGFQEQIGIPVSIRESKRSFLNKLVSLVKGIITYPDEYKNWKPRALQTAERILREEKIDAVISIWPVTSHLIAKELKQKYKIPWIADFPDLWSQNVAYPYGFLRRLIDKKTELKTLQNANVLTTVSRPLAKKLKTLHKKKLVFTITHGFDLEKANIPPTNLTTKFTITYTGRIYKGRQDPSKFLIDVKELIADRKINPNNIEVRFYGPEEPLLLREIEEHKLSSVVKYYGVISHEDALKKQWESQVLLLLNWEDPKEKGVYTGKVFEYLAARRPILVTGGFEGDVLEKLMKETRAGVHCPSITKIKEALVKFYSEYQRTGKVTYYGDWAEIQKYSSQEMARKFANILNQIT